MKTLTDLIIEAVYSPDSGYTVVDQGVQMRSDRPVGDVVSVQSKDGRRYEVTIREVAPKGDSGWVK